MSFQENKQGATIIGAIGRKTRKKVEELVQIKKLPITMIVGIAIDNEFQRDNPFNYDVNFPEGEYEEYTFVEEASRILTWLKECGGASLERLMLYREDMNISDRDTFLLAFKECLEKKFIEAYKPVQPKNAQVKYDDTYVFYRVVNTGRKIEDKKKRESTRYEKYLKLKREFEGK